MRILFVLCVIAVLSLAGERVSAHHSFSAFEAQEEVRLSGTISEVQYTNPHTWFFVDVVDDAGRAETWAIETGSPNMLIRKGWKKNTVKVGDKVKVLIHPMRDPQKKGGALINIILPDGKTISD